jgi:hypothetical protein
MELTRRQFAFLLAGIYCAAGLLLTADYLAAPSGPGAHVPLAWHVLPVSLTISLLTLIMGSTGPLDSTWDMPVAVVAGSFIAAMAICATALVRLISGRAKRPIEETGKLEP